MTLPPLASLELGDGESAFLVVGGEADVNEDLIRRFTVGARSVSANYHNKSESRLRARYKIELYNAYGVLLGEASVGAAMIMFGTGPGYIDPGDVSSEELRVTWHPVDRILAKSPVSVPEDWQTIKWVVTKEIDHWELQPRGDNR